jgi:tight adherence protein B
VFAGPHNGQVGGSVAATGLGLDVVTMGASGSGLATLTELANGAGGRVLAGTDGASVTAQWQEVGRHFPAPLAVTATVPNRWGGATALVQGRRRRHRLRDHHRHVRRRAHRAAATPSSPPLSMGAGLAALRSSRCWCFAAVILVMLALVWPRSEAHERIKQIAHFRPGRSVPAVAPEPVPTGIRGWTARPDRSLAASATVVRTANWEDRIALRLDRAGMKWRPHEWLLIRTLITIAGGSCSDSSVAGSPACSAC